MNITARFILPADLVFIPHAELSEAAREHSDIDVGEFVVTRRHARAGSKVVGESGVNFLRHFEQPRTIVQAVLDSCHDNAEDPESYLKEAFPLVELMVKSRFLIADDDSSAADIEPLANGTVVDGWTVHAMANRIEDCEVYQVISSAGVRGALKIARPGFASARQGLHRESTVLDRLAGQVSPALLGLGEHQGCRYIVMEWRAGRHVTHAADSFHARGTQSAPGDLDRVCSRVFAAYAQLHAMGIVHADVHPGNILIDETLEVALIDFGFARLAAEPAELRDPGRAAVPSFMDPQFAQSRLHRTRQPVATQASDQYCAAAVAFRLLTGQHYLALTPERGQMLRQIVEDPVRSFAACGVVSRPAVEAVLARALSKSPSLRFDSMSDLGDAFEAACRREPPTVRPQTAATTVLGPRLTLFRDAYFERLGSAGNLIDVGVSRPPTASVNTGAAGLAYACYAEAQHRGDPELLSTADVWSERAAAEAKAQVDRAFYADSLGITADTVGSQSLYHREPGVQCVRGLVAAARGDAVGVQRSIEAYTQLASLPMENLDLTLGRAGIVLGAALLREAAPPTPLIDLGPLDSTIRAVLAGIWKQIERLPPIRSQSEVTFLGMAHGWAGLLYATLTWSRISGDPVQTNLHERLKELADFSSGEEILRWPRTLPRRGHQGNSMPGWCNGSAGFVYLWTAAAESFGPGWLGLAEGAAMDAWSNIEGINNLCCGLSGRCFALVHLHRITQDRVWLDRAREIASREGAISGLGSDGLYKGDAGIALMISALENPSRARMPLFEPIGGNL